MHRYQKILVAVELTDKTDRDLLEKAKTLTDQATRIYLVHAVEHLNAYGSAQAYPAIADVEHQISKEHQTILTQLAEEYQIDAQHTFIEMGTPASVVANKANEIGADLVIVGSQTRHGLAVLLGSTADSILHKTPCDILAVRLGKIN